MRLESDQIINAALRIVAPQLNDGVRLLPRLRVAQAARLERAVAERIVPAARHDLNGHAALENVLILKAVHFRFLRRGQRLPEGFILLLAHRAVDVVRRALIVARGKKRRIHVDALKGHERGGGVEEVQRVPVTDLFRDGGGERIARQRARGDDDIALGNGRHLAGRDRNIGVRADLLRHEIRKALAVYRQRAARFHARRVRAGHDERIEAAQFFFEKAHRVLDLVRAQRI